MYLEINPQDMDEVKKLFADLGKDAPRALVRSINKTLPGVRTDMTSALTAQYNVTAMSVRKSFGIQKASLVKPSGLVSTKGAYLNLIEFGANQTQKGVTVKILRQGDRKLLPGAFVATMKTGKTLVLQRKWHLTKTKPRPGVKYGRLPEEYRLPIKPLWGPRLQDHLGRPEIWLAIEIQATERLLKAAAHEADYLIKQQLEAGDGFTP